MKLLTKVSDLFDQLGQEEPQDFKEFKVERTPGLDVIIKEFEKVYKGNWVGFRMQTIDNFHNICERNIPGKYTAKDIEQFSLALTRYQDDPYFEIKAGLYLSLLMKHCTEQDITIYTNHLEKDIPFLGRQNNGKHITVKGNVGTLVGDQMETGEIHVNGNAGDNVGNKMKGGRLVIDGNAGTEVGHGMENGQICVNANVGSYLGIIMEGGVIRVRGNAGKYVGRMKNGEIHIDGSMVSLGSKREGGNIYHKGIQIVKNGKMLK